MGDKDNRTVGKMLLEVLEQLFFCLHVKGGGGFIQQEHLAWMQDGTGNGDTLGLPL